MRAPDLSPPRSIGWRRRIRRGSPAGSLVRGLRILALLLAVSGCAVEGPRPVAVTPPPEVPAVPPPIISGFGDWTGAGGGPRLWQHAGIDIRVPTGTPILAAADGTVVRATWRPLAGKLVLVLHDEALATAYYHLSEILVTVGQVVRRGDPVGRAGMTGNSTTPHLHFAVCTRPAGQCGAAIEAGWTDPVRYWVDGNPCLTPGRTHAVTPLRLSYPVPCPAAS